MKKPNEKEISSLKIFCLINLAAVLVLCLIYLLGSAKARWVLNGILALAVLLHVSFALYEFLRHRKLAPALSALLALCCIAAAVKYNL